MNDRYLFGGFLAATILVLTSFMVLQSCEAKPQSDKLSEVKYEDVQEIEHTHYKTDQYLITVIEELEMVCVRPFKISSQNKHGPVGCKTLPDE